MGYTTEFTGSFKLDRPLAQEHRDYLLKFAETRRMQWVSDKIKDAPDPIRIAAGLPIGPLGCYFTGATDDYGQERSPRVLADKEGPNQPGCWCQWVPNEDGTAIEWNGAEKFYYYRQWLDYLIVHFLKRWGYTLNGSVEWVGEDPSDQGVLVVHANSVTTELK